MANNRLEHLDESDRITRIETILERLEMELLGGNGRPGWIEKLNEWKSGVDKDRAWVQGAYKVIATVVGALGLGGIYHVLSGGK